MMNVPTSPEFKVILFLWIVLSLSYSAVFLVAECLYSVQTRHISNVCFCKANAQFCFCTHIQLHTVYWTMFHTSVFSCMLSQAGKPAAEILKSCGVSHHSGNGYKAIFKQFKVFAFTEMNIIYEKHDRQL